MCHDNFSACMLHIGIITGPRSINISLNQEAVLACTAFGDHITWLANETSIYDLIHKDWKLQDKETVVKQNIQSELKILGTININQTNITCHVVQLPSDTSNYSYSDSEPALVQVQGTYSTKQHAC